jgi:hypothetical protein
MDRVYYGSDLTISHPLVKRLGIDAIISGWDKIFDANKDKYLVDFINLEKANRSKVGPRSISVPWSERKHSLEAYFSADKETVSSPSDLQGVAQLQPRLRPITASAAVRFLKSSTSSGLPFLVKKGEIKDQLVNEYDYLLKRRDCCVLLTRTQEGGKTRDVWGYPAADTLKEMCFFQPFLSFEKGLPWRSALVSPDAVDLQIDKLINDAIRDDRSLVCIDFPQYDASLKPKMQAAAFSWIKSSFQRQHHQEIDELSHRFANIGIVTPDGVKNGEHGVPSGSTFTNTVDSAVQHLISKDLGVLDSEKQIQGDDGVYLVDSEEALYNHFSKYGLDVNPEKCYVSKRNAIYLQNFYSKDMLTNGICRGVYPSYRALGRIFFQERFTDLGELELEGSDFNSLRVISILENCKYHPLFIQLVNYIAKLDKYSLGYSQSGLVKYVGHLISASGIEGIFNYRRGDDIRGINSFQTVKLLSKLSIANTS